MERGVPSILEMGPSGEGYCLGTALSGEGYCPSPNAPSPYKKIDILINDTILCIISVVFTLLNNTICYFDIWIGLATQALLLSRKWCGTEQSLMPLAECAREQTTCLRYTSCSMNNYNKRRVIN